MLLAPARAVATIWPKQIPISRLVLTKVHSSFLVSGRGLVRGAWYKLSLKRGTKTRKTKLIYFENARYRTCTFGGTKYALWSGTKHVLLFGTN